MPVIVVYCEHITPRVEYIFAYMLEAVCGFTYRITPDEQAYRTHGGPTLNYSRKRIKENEIHFIPNGLLQLETVTPCEGIVKQEGETVPLFLNGPGIRADCFDPFAASFYLLTRYEEYFDYAPDAFGRFEAASSLLFKAGLLHRPLVNEWAEALRQTFSKTHAGIPFRKNRFSYKMTIDVDQAFAFRHRGLPRNLLSFFKNTAQWNTLFLRSQLETLFLNKTDPYDTFEYLKKTAETFSLPAIYFINVGPYSKYDKNLPATNARFKKVINSLKPHAEIGLHPSYFSNAMPQKFGEEKNTLEQMLGRPVTQSRQHYLRLQFPQTYRHLLAIGITEDYTMGYATHPGFRAGTCTPFQWFDLQANRSMPLKIFPVAYMENTFAEDLRMQPEEALRNMEQLTDTVRLHNGCHISIWHNSSVNDQLLWKGWKAVFETSIKHLVR